MNENLIEENNTQFQRDYAEMMKLYLQKTKMVNKPNEDIDEEGGKVITPIPCYCLKTKDSSGQKIFLNILSHELIQAPKEENILEMDNQYGVRIPLSLSEKFEDFDNKMGVCQVYDIVLSDKVAQKVEKEEALLGFLYQMICHRVFEKYKHQLDAQFIRMKKMKYKGKSVRTQRIRVKKAPKIEEVIEKASSSENLSNKIKEIQSDATINSSSKAKQPEWNFFIVKRNTDVLRELNEEISGSEFLRIVEYNEKLIENKLEAEFGLDNILEKFDGFNCSPKHGNGIIFVVSLRLINKIIGISLNMSDEGFAFQCGKIYSLCLSVPYKVDSSKSEAYFDTERRLLIMLFPFNQREIEKEIERKNEESTKQKKLTISQPELNDNYLFDVL